MNPYSADNFKDAATGNSFRPHEIESITQLEKEFGGVSSASKIDEAGDVIMKGGKLNGQSLDPLGLSEDALSFWKSNFEFAWREKRMFVNSIDKHFKKIHTPISGKPPLDKVIIDFKYIDEVGIDMRQKVIDSIYNGLDVGGKRFPQKYKQYLNDNYFIKLNF